jgi:hypothetical protein
MTISSSEGWDCLPPGSALPAQADSSNENTMHVRWMNRAFIFVSPGADVARNEGHALLTNNSTGTLASDRSGDCRFPA